MTEYWLGETDVPRFSALFEIRGHIALVLVEKWGTVAGYSSGEDTAGRARLDLLPPQELVDRCITIAELLVEGLERKQWIKRDEQTSEERAKRSGELHGIQEHHRWESKLTEKEEKK